MADMLRVPPNLPGLIQSAFKPAEESGDVIYYATKVALLNTIFGDDDIPRRGATESNAENQLPTFQLRFAPTLANKPKPPTQQNGQKGEKPAPFNPFLNPSPIMTVTSIPPSHTLVLNKFAVVPEHSILITREYKPQTHILELEDIAATLACVRAYRRGSETLGTGGGLYAFFNCGPCSGASQPHRHVQLLSICRMRDGLDEAVKGRGGRWDVLIDELASGEYPAGCLPFQVLTQSIDDAAPPEDVYTLYLKLYRRAVQLVHPHMSDEKSIATDGEALTSYNFAMTQKTIAICPRIAEGASIKDSQGKDIGMVQLNGTMLAGTVLVKSQVEWDALREDPGILRSLLGKVGVPVNE